MTPDEQKTVAEKKLHEMMQKVLASRNEGTTEEEQHRFFEIAARKYDAMGEMACSVGILNPRDVDRISQYEAQEWFASHRDEVKIPERNETPQNEHLKVLIEVDEARLQEVTGIITKPEIGVKILGTEKDMALDSVFSAEDIWNCIADPNGDVAMEPFDSDKLSNIESYGRKEFLETVISRLNHHFDASEGVNWNTVYNTAEGAYNDLALDREQSAVVDHISVDGLRTALQRYDENGKQGECGPWEIHDGGYDCWWELCHNGQVIVSCHASGEYENGAELGNIERERHLAEKSFANICKIVGEEFPECRMSPQEQEKINENKQSLGR